jgi:hypothetical protein
MAIKPERGRYLTLEDVRVSYKHKDDTIHLTSQDPEIPNGEFFITLNRNTSTETALRELLTEHDLIRKEDTPPVKEQPSFRSGINPIPEHLMAAQLGNYKNTPGNYALIGAPGCGKTVLAIDTVARAYIMNIPTTVIGIAADYIESLWASGLKDITYYNFGIAEKSTKFTTPLPLGHLNPFQMKLSEEELTTVLKKILLSVFMNRGKVETVNDFYATLSRSFIQESATTLHKEFLKQEPDPTLLKFFAFLADIVLTREAHDGHYFSMKEWLTGADINKLLSVPALSWNTNRIVVPPRARVEWYDTGDFSNIHANSGTLDVFSAQLFGELIYAKQAHHYNTRADKQKVELLVLDNVGNFQGMNKSYAHLTRLTRSSNLIFVSTHQQMNDFQKYYAPDSGLVQFLLFRGANEHDSQTSSLKNVTTDMLNSLRSGEFWCSDATANGGVVHVVPHISFNINLDTNPSSRENKPSIRDLVKDALRQDPSNIIIGEVRPSKEATDFS